VEMTDVLNSICLEGPRNATKNVMSRSYVNVADIFLNLCNI